MSPFRYPPMMVIMAVPPPRFPPYRYICKTRSVHRKAVLRYPSPICFYRNRWFENKLPAVSLEAQRPLPLQRHGSIVIPFHTRKHMTFDLQDPASCRAAMKRWLNIIASHLWGRTRGISPKYACSTAVRFRCYCFDAYTNVCSCVVCLTSFVAFTGHSIGGGFANHSSAEG